jgi:hypothetical protein
VTPWFYTGTPAKESWLFVINAAYDAYNRFGLQMRPGLKGGMWPAIQAQAWDTDYFSNSPAFDGEDMVFPMNHGNTARTIFTYGSTPLNGSSGSGLLIGKTYGTPISDGTPTTSYNAIMSTYITLGAPSPTSLVRHPMSYKNLSIFPNQFTKADSVLWSQMP